MRLEGWHFIIIIIIAIVLFGAPKLPAMARSLGQSMRIFKSEVKQMKDENNAENTESDVTKAKNIPPSDVKSFNMDIPSNIEEPRK